MSSPRSTYCPGAEPRRHHVDPDDRGTCARCGTLLELRVGQWYVSLGPAPGGKLGEPKRVQCERVDIETGRYHVSHAKGASADVIAFGAEHLWRAQ